MVGLGAAFGYALVAFVGGAIGAAIGGRRAYGLAGVLVVVGEVLTVVRRPPAPAAVDYTSLDGGLTATLGLGPAFGPHVAFAGGVAAAAYAARRGYLDTDFDYHEAKHIGRSLGARPDVLAVGGVFGVVGLLLARLSVALSLPWDPIAASVVLSAFLHRLAFGYPAVGDVRGELLDMSPYDRGERREPVAPEGDTGARRRLVVEPWLPHQSRWPTVAVVGVVVGALAALVAHRTGSPFLAFGLAAATLLLADLDEGRFPRLARLPGADRLPDAVWPPGIERLPVTHHAAFPAGVAVVALAGSTAPADIAASLPLGAALLVGAGFGLLAALAAELAQRALYAHAETHLDPPSVGILVATLLVALLDVFGFVQLRVIPAPF